MTTVYQLFQPDVPSNVVNTQALLMGIECEVEGVRDYMISAIEGTWGITEDGSLRNNGREFVSVPTPSNAVVPAFRNLHASIFCRDGQKFSERTSIHVHVNCANRQVDQVKSVVLYYALFEEIFFSLVDPSRRHNIHCVPLTETYIPAYYKATLQTMVSRWQKYTALNLLPLKKYGTIEFRHMEGHDDDRLFGKWVGVLENLMTYGSQNIMQPAYLTDEEIHKAFDFIFKDTQAMMLKPLLNDLTFNQKLDLKLAFI